MTQRRKLKILLVDDDPIWRSVLAGQLAHYGRLTQASSLKEALQILNQENFDICFFDMELEVERAGLILVERASSHGHYSVIISSHEEADIIIKAYTLGCRDYLIKPASTETVEKCLEKFFNLTSHSDRTVALKLTKEQQNILIKEGYESFIKKIGDMAKEFAIGKTKNLTEAAKFLGLSKGTISKHKKNRVENEI